MKPASSAPASLHSRRRFLAAAGWLSLATAAAQTDVLSLDDLIQSGQRLAEQHLDPRAVEALRNGVDPAKADTLLKDIQKRFQGQYVVDVAQFRDTAKTLLPILENVPATRPYAGWLRPRMDYFQVADELEVHVPPPRPGQPAPPRTNPTAEQERRAWEVQVGGTQPPRGATGWVSRLKPVFRAQRVPQELVWVAEVESAFDPQAVSPAGAAGLYQLMPATAQSLGLKLKPQDERFTGEKNARAAAGYLRTLHQKFRDWRLALASYNAGPGRVSELLKQRGARTFDQIAPHLLAETQMYVPKIEAVIQRREGRALTTLPAAG